MATSRKKNKFTIKFELGVGGLLSVGIVVFCVFLWMFLFGVWTGQTLLEPSGEQKEGLPSFSFNFWKQNSADSVEELKPLPTSKTNEPAEDTKEEHEPAHFSLQVAAFRDPEKARKIVLQWRARDYESFFLAPEQPNGSFYRVFVGVFDEMAEAKKLAASLEEKGKDKFFVTLIPVSEKRYP